MKYFLGLPWITLKEAATQARLAVAQIFTGEQNGQS